MQRTFIRVCVFVYLLLIVFAATVDGGVRGDKIVMLLSSIGLVFTASIPLIFSFKTSGFLHPLVLTSALALANMIVKTSGTLAYGLDFHVGLPGHSAKSLARLVTYINVLGMISFFAKYAGFVVFGPGKFPLFKFSKKPNALFLPLLLLWLALGLTCLAFLVTASGGISYQLKNMHLGEQNRVYTGDTSLFGTFAVIIQSCVIIPTLYAVFRKNGHKSPIFFALVICTFLMVYMTSGRRSSILVPTYLGFAVWIYKERKLPIVRILLMAFLMFLFLAAGRIFRTANQNSSTRVNMNFLKGYSVSDLAEVAMGELTERGGNSSAVYPIVEMVPRRVNYNYFQSYMENFYRFVPRAFWPDKPEGIGITCSEVFFNRYNAGGVPPGAMGEAYWSLGIFGVVIVFFLFGMVLRFCSNMFQDNVTSTGMVVIYLLTLVRLGPDQISFRVWIFTMVPLLLFAFAANLISLKGR